MRPRLAFTFSLVVACILHALILVVPRFTGLTGVSVPAIELTFESARPVGAEPDAGPPPVRRAPAATRAAAAVVLPTQGPAPAQFPAPAAGSEKSEASLLLSSLPAPTAEFAAGPSGSSDPVSASGTAVAAEGSAGASGIAAEGGETVDAGAASALIPPHPKAEILPAYPRSARRAGLEGIVRITAYIDEAGSVVGAEVLSSSGHDALDKAALEAVQHAYFAPALQAGRAVPCRLIIPVRFKLN
jgi:protein TonB